MTTAGRGNPELCFPDPRVPVPPGPVRVQMLPGWFQRCWQSLPAPQQHRFLAAWEDLELPLIDPDPKGEPGFRAVTFLHLADSGEDVSAVILSANSLVHPDNLDACEFSRVTGTDLWALTYRMPSDWEASYRITVHAGSGPAPWRISTDRRTVRLTAHAGGPDPRNPVLGADMNGAPQSVLRLPDSQAAPWLAPAAPGGSTSTAPGLQIWTVPDSGAGRDRVVWIYGPPAPAGCTPVVPTPLLLLHDGQVWAKHLNLKDALDTAISTGVMPPIHVAMIDSGDVATRSRELSGPAGSVDFIAKDLLPQLRTQLPVHKDPRNTIASGASYGGLASLWQVARYPELVGAALAQSPSVWRFDMSAPLAAVTVPRTPESVRISIQAGVYETTVHTPAAILAEHLANIGANIRFHSVTGGHDWAWWNPWLIRGLAELLQDPTGSVPVRP